MARIVHLLTGLGTGGAEVMLSKLLASIERGEFEQAVVSIGDRGSLGSAIEELGIPLHCLGMRSLVLAPLYTLRLIRLLRELQPDLIQSWMYNANLAALISAVWLPKSVPVVWNVRGNHTDLSAERLRIAVLVRLGGRLSSLPAAIVNNSRTSMQAHTERFGYRAERWRLIPNGFDLQRFQPDPHAKTSLAAELGLPENCLLIGLIGRYHPVKGHANFLTAAGSLRSRWPQVRFVLAGKDVDGNNLELVRLVARLNLSRDCYLLGERNDIERLTAALDIACSASSVEGFSNTLGEAMCCRVPCVATDVGDSAWLLGESGVVVPPADAEAFAAGVERLLKMNAQERKMLGERARRRIEENFSLPAVVTEYERLYRALLSSEGEAGR